VRNEKDRELTQQSKLEDVITERPFKMDGSCASNETRPNLEGANHPMCFKH
jgi:hypothetical protein